MINQVSHSSQLGSGIVFLVFASVAVALRFYSKTLTKSKLAADDWWISLSLLCLYAWIGVQYWGMYSEVDQEHIQMTAYTLMPIFGLTVTATKLSILCLYDRIFGVVKRFHQICRVISLLCLVWWLVFTLVAMIPCRPVKKFWEPNTPGTCYNFNEFTLGVTLVDIALDMSILLLPISSILHLKMSKGQKLMLCAIFLVGGFVIVTNIVRLKLIYVPHDQSFEPGVVVLCAVWSNVHIGTAIVCACLPTYRPVVKGISSRISSVINIRGSRESASSADTYVEHLQLRNPNHRVLLPCFDDKMNRHGQADITQQSKNSSFEKVRDGFTEDIESKSSV